ncbi:hypothetical protein HDU67_009493, partial [Dinochytrium kinnereticum]
MQERLKTVEALLSGLMHQGVNTSSLLPSGLKAEASLSPDVEDDDDSVASMSDDEMDSNVPLPGVPMPQQLLGKRSADNNGMAMVVGKRRNTGVRPESLTVNVEDMPLEVEKASSSNFYLEEEAFSGFRGIALSLQRKLRHNAQRSPQKNGEAQRSGEGVRSGTGKDAGENLEPAEEAGDAEIELDTADDPDSLVAHRMNNDNGEITIIEDLSSDTILFYGRTSTTTSAAWRQSPRFAKGIMSISLSFEAAEKDAPMVEPPPCSPDLVHHLVSLYFEHVHPYFPMIHRPSFLRQLKARRTEHFSFLLNSMCALVTQQCRDLSEWGVGSPAELHGTFFERARVLLGRQFDWPHINNVQAMLLLCMVGQGTNINASIAHRQAVELGMHRNLDNMQHPQLDTTLRETMRITWFCLYILDRYTSVVEGRPMAINDDDWDTPFPSGTSPDIVNLASHVSLCEILGRIANFVNRPGPPGRPRWLQPPSEAQRPPPNPKEIISDINAMLSLWFKSLPDNLSPTPSHESSWTFHHHLHAMYHTAIVLLHRLDVGRFDESCTQSAVHISHILSTSLPVPLRDPIPESASPHVNPPGGFVFVMPLVVYAALTSSTLFLDSILAKSEMAPRSGMDDPKPIPLPTSPKSKVTHEDLRRSLVAFEKLRDTSLFASYYRQLIVEVLRCHGVCVEGIPELEGVEGGAGAGPGPGVAPAAESGERQTAKEQGEREASGAERGSKRKASAQKKMPASQPSTEGCPNGGTFDEGDMSQFPQPSLGGPSYPSHTNAYNSNDYSQTQYEDMNDPDDPVSRLRAAAKAAIAAAQASQAAATLRAARHGLHPVKPPHPLPRHHDDLTSRPASAMNVPSGAAVPRASHFRMAATNSGAMFPGGMPFPAGGAFPQDGIGRGWHLQQQQPAEGGYGVSMGNARGRAGYAQQGAARGFRSR